MSSQRLIDRLRWPGGVAYPAARDRTRDHAGADDAAQGAMLASADGEGPVCVRHGTAFVRCALARRVLDLWRRRRRWARGQAREAELAAPGPTVSSASNLAGEIEAAFDQLDESLSRDEFLVLTLIADGLSRPEVAERIGRTESAVGGLYYRGRRKLGLVGGAR